MEGTTKTSKRKTVSPFARAVRRLRRTITRAETPSSKMLYALNESGRHIYAGTANTKAVAKRRAKNKVASRSRAINARRR